MPDPITTPEALDVPTLTPGTPAYHAAVTDVVRREVVNLARLYGTPTVKAAAAWLYSGPDAPTPTPAEWVAKCEGCVQGYHTPAMHGAPTPAGDDQHDPGACAPGGSHEDHPWPCGDATASGDDQREAVRAALMHYTGTHSAVIDAMTADVLAVRPSAPTVTTEQHAAMARGLYVAVYGTRAADQFPDAVQAVGGRLAGIALAALGLEVTP